MSGGAFNYWVPDESCEYGMVPNCYARYMEPNGFCSLAKRRADR